MSETESTAYSSNAVFPMPASPVSTRTPLRPARAPATNPLRTADSCRRSQSVSCRAPEEPAAISAAHPMPGNQPAGLSRLSDRRAVGQRLLELIARGDAELGEHLAQRVVDGVLADEQARSDLDVRETIAREPGHLSLLCCELIPALDASFVHVLPRRQQLAPGASSEPLQPDRIEHLERRAEVLASVAPTALAI